MEENLKWVWAAFSVAWVIHLAYLFVLATRQKGLKDQVRDLRAQLEEHNPEGGAT